MNGQLALNIKTSYVLEEFIAVHYGQSAFNGHIILGARKNGQSSIYRFRSIETQKLQENIGDLHFKNMDYYITANSFSGLDRKMDKLFALENIVIDIDYHAENLSSVLHYNRIQKLLRSIQQQMPDYIPNTVVRTGRGVQLWYSLKPAHKSLEHLYTELVNIIISKINTIILKDRDLYDYFGCVDAAPSRNLAGYFRLPGTYNTKSGCMGTFEIWHDQKIDLTSVTIEKTEKKKKSTEIIYLPKSKDGYILAKKRIYQMQELRSIRTRNNEKEQRDLMNLIIYCSCAAAYDGEELKKIVKTFNAGHKNPLPEKELWQQLSTAEKKKYKLSNKWIIESLSITEEEQEKIGLRVKSSISGREIERQDARERKQKRNEQIIYLALEGYTYKEISSLVKCSEKTVGRVITSAGAKKTWSVLHTQILELFSTGYTKEETAELLGVCERTIERHLQMENFQEDNAETPENEEYVEQSKEKIKKSEESGIVSIYKKSPVMDNDIKNDKTDKTAPIYFFSIGGYG